MARILVVPIYLDALVLDKPIPVAEAFGDFSRLPHSNGEIDVNPDVSNISENILSQPFQNKNLYLDAGVHLHWSLPDVLTVGKRDADGKTEFPAVPNCWLVTRNLPDGEKKQWIVESDYLHGEGEGNNCIAYPHAETHSSSRFRYLGRWWDWDDWIGPSPENRRLDKLTAVGFGEPAFAAFYPNSHSVFGFFDDKITDAKQLQGVTYEVLGWYSDIAKDYFTVWIKNFDNSNDAVSLLDKQLEALKELNKWAILDKVQELPKQMVCFAKIGFKEPVSIKSSNGNTDISVAIGNTSTEALSAYLANKLDPKSKTTIEDQLEALHLTSRLEHRRLDIGPKFKEARHTKGFKPVSAGSIWTLQPEMEAPENEAKTKPEQMTLPNELASLLNDLNCKQQKYDRVWQEIESLQRQLFADWYKYMLCVYPPLDAPDDYPDIDEVKRFIEINYLHKQAPLQAKIEEAGKLGLVKEPDQVGQLRLSAEKSGPSLAASVIKAANDLLDSEAMSELQKMMKSDVQDWNDFLIKLRQSAFLSMAPSLLADKEPDQGKDQVDCILGELNNRIFMRDFCLNIESHAPALSDTAKKLLVHLKDSAASPRHIWLRLNRLFLESLFPGCIAHRSNYILRLTHAPRYWEPNDPVVLITGDAASPTGRYGTEGKLYKDGFLQCKVVSTSNEKIEATTLKTTHAEINNQIGTLGYQVWERQPWNPIMLEWEVEFFPTMAGNNLRPGHPGYDHDFITNNYKLPTDAADFNNTASNKVMRGANVYSGRAILTPHAKNQLKLRLEEYLKTDETEASSQDLRNMAKQAYEELQTTNVLAQALGGFNQALLMCKQTFQLPVADPIGFEDYQGFSESSSKGIGHNNWSAPQPLNDFDPIRAGEMKILRLRLIDTFGQVRDINCENQKIVTSETMSPQSGSSLPVRLPPRLSQPARLNFRWLAAEAGLVGEEEAEMNDHPATSPICGWILPNHLDGSLVFYAQSGRALGSLDQNGKWHEAPGESRISIGEIPNPHLRKLVDYLVEQTRNDFENKYEVCFLSDFLQVVERALENIEPESVIHNNALALLIGRPIAVVRASLNLELRGRPAVHQGWNVFRQDLGRDTRDTNAFPGVKFPIRIGEFEQLNDGLIGYWVEKTDMSLEDTFYAPQTITDKGSKIHRNIQTHQPDASAIIYQSIDDPAHKLTMLIDPRGAVHATCGILPTKAIHIPPGQFAEAIHHLEVTFLTAPILTDAGKVSLPLPAVDGYEWSWVEKEKGIWTSEFQITPVNPQAAFAAKQEIREGWLKLKRSAPPNNGDSKGD